MITTAPREFRDALADGGRLAGLDVGTRTIGIATCDAGWSFATAHSTLARTKFSPDLAKLQALLAAERVTGIVIGLPLSMDGSDSPRTQSVRQFAKSYRSPARPPSAVVGRALVDGRGRAHHDRRRPQPGEAARDDRQARGGAYPAGRDRRADACFSLLISCSPSALGEGVLESGR